MNIHKPFRENRYGNSLCYITVMETYDKIRSKQKEYKFLQLV